MARELQRVAPIMRGSVTFISTMCLLDNTSGAAISIRNILAALARAGFQCQSFTASLFDPHREVPLGEVLGKEADDPTSKSKCLILEVDGITHNVFLTKSSQIKNMSFEEKAKMKKMCGEWIQRNNPDIVISFGQSEHAQDLQNLARNHGARLLFYLGNAEYSNSAFFSDGDSAICPSRFLSDYYRTDLGIAAEVVRPIMTPEQWISPGEESIASVPSMRKSGFVTFVNPIPHKGLALFVRLAQLAARERPDMRFLVVEGRMTRELLREWEIDIGAYPNVWWIPTQSDVKAIYRRTSVLLVPSFWREGFARSVIEAQLSGIPVLASTRGGLPEALNGGGLALEVPEKCLQNHYAYPDRETVHRWMDALTALWDDEDAYADATVRARRAAEPFHPDTTSAAAVAFFDRILRSSRQEKDATAVLPA